MHTQGELAYYEFERVFGSVRGDPRSGDTIALRPDDEPEAVIYHATTLAALLRPLRDGAGLTRINRQHIYTVIAAAVVLREDDPYRRRA
jgi:hypothetical protein